MLRGRNACIAQVNGCADSSAETDLEMTQRVDAGAALLEALQAVHSTQASVEQCSKLMLDFVRDASASDAVACVQIWADEVRDAQPPARLALVWVANDVLQKARMRKIDGFRAAFEGELVDVFRVAKEESPRFASKLLRLCGVWKQRRIFDGEFTLLLRGALRSGGSEAVESDDSDDDEDEDGIDDDDDEGGDGGGYGAAASGEAGLSFLFGVPGAVGEVGGTQTAAAQDDAVLERSGSAGGGAVGSFGVDVGIVEDAVTLPAILAHVAQQEVSSRAHRAALAAADIDEDIAGGSRDLEGLVAAPSLARADVASLRRQVGLAMAHRSAAAGLLRRSKEDIARLGKVLQTARAEQVIAVDQLTQQLHASDEIKRGLSVLRKRHGADAGSVRLRRKIGVRAAVRPRAVAVDSRRGRRRASGDGATASAPSAHAAPKKTIWNAMLRMYVVVEDQQEDEDWRN